MFIFFGFGNDFEARYLLTVSVRCPCLWCHILQRGQSLLFNSRSKYTRAHYSRYLCSTWLPRSTGRRLSCIFWRASYYFLMPYGRLRVKPSTLCELCCTERWKTSFYIVRTKTRPSKPLPSYMKYFIRAMRNIYAQICRPNPSNKSIFCHCAMLSGITPFNERQPLTSTANKSTHGRRVPVKSFPYA